MATRLFAFFLYCSAPIVKSRTHHEFSTLLVVPTYMLSFQLGKALGKAQKILFQVFGSFSSWYSYYWARLSYLIHNSEALLPHHRLISGNFGYTKGSVGKHLSTLLVSQPVYWLRKIWSRHHTSFWRKLKDDNHN